MSYNNIVKEIQEGTLLNELIYIVFNERVLNIINKTNNEYLNIIQRFINVDQIILDNLNDFESNNIDLWSILINDIYKLYK